jgi:hypothetical protein
MGRSPWVASKYNHEFVTRSSKPCDRRLSSKKPIQNSKQITETRIETRIERNTQSDFFQTYLLSLATERRIIFQTYLLSLATEHRIINETNNTTSSKPPWLKLTSFSPATERNQRNTQSDFFQTSHG